MRANRRRRNVWRQVVLVFADIALSTLFLRDKLDIFTLRHAILPAFDQ